jgi:hypothetical protein
MDEPHGNNPEKPPAERTEPEWSGISAASGGFSGRVRLKADKLHAPVDADERWEAPDESWSSHAEEIDSTGSARHGLRARLRHLFGRS